jgi:hypothetical protein
MDIGLLYYVLAQQTGPSTVFKTPKMPTDYLMSRMYGNV